MPHDIIFKNVIDFFDTHIPPAPQGKSICAAVSGGCDSVALFYALFALRDRLGITRLGIAHVNHRLRGAESDADAAFVKEMGVKAIVPFHEKILGPRPPRGGMEEWARAERYGFFRNLCTAEGYDYIATGHTADDQAETVFMRIMRGSGLKGLCAIAPVREDHVIRPLLNINRASLCAWLKEKDTMFREDSSNKDIAYHRNLVRHILLPAFFKKEPRTAEFLQGIAGKATAAWRLLSYHINKWCASYVIPGPNGGFILKKIGVTDFPFSHEAVAEVLRKNRIRFDLHHVEELVSNASRTSGVFLLPEGWRYRCGNDIIEFTRHFNNDVPALFSSPSLDIPSSPRSAGLNGVTLFRGAEEKRAGTSYAYTLMIGSSVACEALSICIEIQYISRGAEPVCYCKDNMTVFLDAETINEPIEFRNVKKDDAFQPLGCRELRHVKEFLKKRKKNFGSQGVVAEKNGRIIWIPGVQISHPCRVTSKTVAILKFSCKHIDVQDLTMKNA